jgi:hypothetical protein
MTPLAPALLLLASLAAGEDVPAATALDNTASLGQSAAASQSPAQAKDAADAPFDGRTLNGDSVSDDGTRTIKKGIPLTAAAPSGLPAKASPPPPDGEKPKGNLPMELEMGGAAVLGGLPGLLAGHLGVALAGAGMGIAAAWLFHKGDYGAAFGVAAGGLIGAAVLGPFGGLIGAAVGGLLGHFLGKLFL